MSHRTEDQSFIDMIKSMRRRLDALEKTMSSAKVNDIRLGDIVVSTDTTNDRLVMRNLITGNSKYLGDPEDVEFSYSGVLVYSVEDQSINSPPYVMPQNSVISEVVLAMTNATTDDINVYIVTGDNTHFFSATLPESSTTHVNPCNIPVGKNSQIYVQLQDLGAADGDAHDLTVILRFAPQTTATRADSVF